MGTTLKPLFSWRSAISDSTLRPTTRHVALALSLYMSERGDSAHPGPTRLAADTGLHLSTVKAALAELEHGGWLLCVTRGGRRGERKHANEYAAAIPEPTLPVVVDDPSPSHTRRRHRDDPSSSPRRPVVVDDPISSENSPLNSSTARGRPRKPIPDDWEPSDNDLEWAAEHYPTIDPWQIAREFRTYWQGEGKPKADWSATYRNRIQQVAARSPIARGTLTRPAW